MLLSEQATPREREADAIRLPPRRCDQSDRNATTTRAGAHVCRHCGIPLQGKAEDGPPESPASDFCCAGCAYVYRLIHEAGLDAYYQIKDQVTAPADAALLPSRDYAWLIAAQKLAEAQAGERAPELRLDVQGISCAGCVWLMERVFQKQPGAGRIEINAQTGQMRLRWQPGFEAAAFARTLQGFNYLVSPASSSRSRPPESRALVTRIGLCAAFAMNVMLFTLPSYFGMEAGFAYARLFGTLSMGFATLSLLAGGGYFLGKAARSVREGALNIDVPIALGIVGAYGGSFFGWCVGNDTFVYFDFVSTFILLMLVGRWAQLAAVERNQRRLLAEQPASACVRVRTSEGAWQARAPEELARGMRFAIGSGHTVPVEGRLAQGEAEMSLAWINGESAPRIFRAGQRVPSGAVNLTRRDVELDATQDWRESLFAELTKPVERNVHRHRFLERVIQGYLIAILVSAVVSGVVWFARTHDAWRSCSVVTAVLVVSCPCAIGLAFPLADEIAAVALRKRGVFVRLVDLWPRLARVKHVVFDKTGTLTLDTPVLVNPRALDALDPEARQVLFTLVSDNLHPIGRALYETLVGRGPVVPLNAEVRETIGCGVALPWAGREWRLGRREWAAPREVPNPQAGKGGETVFSFSGQRLATFDFAEAVRTDAAAELRALERRGLSLHMLSGDAEDRVASLASTLGIEAHAAVAEMTPQDKAGWLRWHAAENALMLGDGANDSFAFDAALCRGTPVVHRGVLTAKADFYYLGRGISGIRALFEVDDARRRTHRWLLGFSIAYNLLAVGLASTGHMSPLLAAILMPLSSLATLAIVGWGMSSSLRFAGRRL